MIKKTKLGTDSVVSFLAMSYNQAQGAVFGMILAGLLGAHDYGLINIAKNIFLIVVVLSPFGLELALQRQLGTVNGSISDKVALVFWPRIVAFSVSVLFVAIFFLGGSTFIASYYQNPDLARVLNITVSALPFATDLAVLGGAFRGILTASPSIIASSFILPTARIIFIFLLLSIESGINSVLYGTVISYVLSDIYLSSKLPKRSKSTNKSDFFYNSLKVFKYSPLLGLGYFIFVISRSIDVIILGIYFPPAEVGRYAIGLMAAQVVSTIGVSLGQTLGTKTAQAAAAGDYTKVGSLLREICWKASLLSAPLCVAISIWGHDIDLILGTGFTMPTIVFFLLAIGQWISTSFNYGSWALVSSGRNSLELLNNVVTLIAQAGACYFLIPKYGILGAASATLISTTTLTLLRQIQISAILKLKILQPTMLAPIIIAFALAYPLLLLDDHVNYRSWWVTGIFVTSYLAIAFAILLYFFAARFGLRRSGR